MELSELRLCSESTVLFFHSSQGLSLWRLDAMSGRRRIFAAYELLTTVTGACASIEVTNPLGMTEE